MSINEELGIDQTDEHERRFGDINRAATKNLYDPSSSRIMQSYISETFKGVGSAKHMYSGLIATLDDEEISKKEFDELELGNDDFQWHAGLKKQKAIRRKENFDRKELNEFIISKANTAENVAGMGLSVLSGFLEPANLASAFLTPIAPAAAYANYYKKFRKTVGLSRNASRLASRSTIGAAEGMLGQAILEPFARESAEALDEDYTMTQSLINIMASGAFGGAIKGGGGYIKDKFTGRLLTPQGETRNVVNKVDEMTRNTDESLDLTYRDGESPKITKLTAKEDTPAPLEKQSEIDSEESIIKANEELLLELPENQRQEFIKQDTEIQKNITKAEAGMNKLREDHIFNCITGK